MNKRILALLSTVFVLAVLVGCAQTSSETVGDAAEEAASDMSAGEAMQITIEKAKELGTMAVAMESEPARISEILESHGISADELQSMLVQIAADAELTDAYEAAREAASAGH